MSSPMVLRVLLACLLVRLSSAPTSALADASVTDPEPAHARGGEPSDEPAEAEDPMAWIGIGVKVGIGRIHSSSLQNPVYQPQLAYQAQQDARVAALFRAGASGACTVIDARCETPGRFGLIVSVPIQLGGDGFGWDIEPYFADADTTRAFGVYTGPKFDIHVADPLYLGFGLGFKAAWVRADTWDYGADLYGRIPVRATLYVLDDLALVLEFAFGAGASGYAAHAQQIPYGMQTITTSPSLTFGVGRTWDASLGVRFP